MAVEIKSLDGTVLYSCKDANSIKACVERAVKEGVKLVLADLGQAELGRADLQGANLALANLVGADLNGANLTGADLSWADLRGASLYGADLTDANLTRINLTGAHIGGAVGINKHLCTPLRILLEQPGRIRAYKLVTADGKSPVEGDYCQSFITYKVGESYKVTDACTDESKMYAPGIQLATLDWCLKHWSDGWRILVAEFTREDIAAIPTVTDGRFRVRECRIVGEKNLRDLGWPEKGGE